MCTSATRRAWSTTGDRKSTRLNSSHLVISYAVFCLKKKSHPPLSFPRRPHAFERANPLAPLLYRLPMSIDQTRPVKFHRNDTAHYTRRPHPTVVVH